MPKRGFSQCCFSPSAFPWFSLDTMRSVLQQFVNPVCETMGPIRLLPKEQVVGKRYWRLPHNRIGRDDFLGRDHPRSGIWEWRCISKQPDFALCWVMVLVQK